MTDEQARTSDMQPPPADGGEDPFAHRSRGPIQFLSLEEIDRRARRWAEAFNGLAQVVEGESMIGGGSLPGSILPTRLVAIGGGTEKKRRSRIQTLARKLRDGTPPIIGRISDNVLLLDPRSVLPEEDQIVHGVLRSLKADF